MDSCTNYSLGNLLGSGHFGDVLKAVHLASKETVAIKFIDYNKSGVEELKTLQSIDHRNIVKYRSSFCHEQTSKLAIVMEYSDLGTLTQYRQKNLFGILLLYQFILQIGRGLEYLRSNNYIHHDLKPDNILVFTGPSGEMLFKISDFGVAQLLTQDAQGKYYTKYGIGDKRYLAPEILKGENYTFSSDLWSLGAVLYFLCHGVDLFNNDYDVLHHNGSITKLGIDATSYIQRLSDPLEAINFVFHSLLEPNRQLRLTLHLLLQKTTQMLDILNFDNHAQPKQTKPNQGMECVATAGLVHPLTYSTVITTNNYTNNSGFNNFDNYVQGMECAATAGLVHPLTYSTGITTNNYTNNNGFNNFNNYVPGMECVETAGLVHPLTYSTCITTSNYTNIRYI